MDDAGLLDWLGRYKKSVVGFLGSVLTWGTTVVATPSSSITAEEWIGLGVAVLNGLVIAKVTNK